jgi:hypothetical protein
MNGSDIAAEANFDRSCQSTRGSCGVAPPIIFRVAQSINLISKRLPQLRRSLIALIGEFPRRVQGGRHFGEAPRAADKAVGLMG